MGDDKIHDFISVIVAVRNEEKYIEKCLLSLINQEFSHKFYQIVVVDGMSTDQTVIIVQKFIRKYPNLIKYYENQKEWQAIGRNIAIQNETDSNLIAYIDGHCIADEKWLKTLYNSLQELNITKVGGVGSIHTSPKDESLIGKAIEQIFFSFIGGFGSSYRLIEKKKEVDTVPFVLYKREALEKVGLYDEGMRYGEDFTLNFKLRQADYKLFVEPKAIVYYYKRNTISSFFKQMHNYGFTKAIVWKKYPSSISAFHYIPSVLIIFLSLLMITSNYITEIKLVSYLLISIYGITIISYSLIYALENKQYRFIELMPVLYIVEHFAYGFGFLKGLFKKGW